MEMLREVKVAKDAAVKARTTAIVALRPLIVTAQDEVREQLEGLPKMSLITRCLALRPGKLDTTLASSEHVPRAITRRWRWRGFHGEASTPRSWNTRRSSKHSSGRDDR